MRRWVSRIGLCCAGLACAAGTAQAEAPVVRVTNTCHEEMYLYLRYQPTAGDWRDAGWYTIAPGQRTTLTHDGEKIRHEFSKYLYVYADTASGYGYFNDADLGSQKLTELSLIKSTDERLLKSYPASGQTRDGTFDWRMTCDKY
ncbi:hypothetical protein ACM25N_03000 [Roseovarius sp. C7]|uniref:hypothetical protein n=1 Tax=Roseovarius sp. C7 TaxID=3398643 RepID=UPI0039F6006E